LNSNFRSNRFY